MNYKKIYEALIKRARNRSVIEGYVEVHHVVPRCLGGTDHQDNLVTLTGREHFIAHHLLVKIHPGVSRLAVAAFLMASRCKTGIKYEKLKIAHSLMMSSMNGGENHPMYGITGEDHHRSRAAVAIEIGKRFETCTAAARWLKENGKPRANDSKICLACSGKRRTAYGLTWRYAEDDDKQAIDPMYRSGKYCCLTGRSGSRSPVARAVMMIETGMRFGTLAEAEMWLRSNGFPKASNASISKVCHGKLRSTCGFKWKFADAA